MAENYEISLGIKLANDDFSNIQNQIKSLENESVKIKLDTKDADNKIDNLKRQLQDLNKNNGNKPSLDINTVSLEKSLDRVVNAIDEIKKSLNTVDGKSGMQSLLSSINQITTALGKAENETDSLVKSLSALSKKDFSLNFNLKAGNSNPVKAMTDYGQAVSRKAIPALKEQINYLRDVIGKTTDADKALERYLVKQNKGFDGIRVKSGLEKQMSSGYDLEGNKISKSDRMLAHEEYLGYLKEVAALNNIDLSGFNAKFSKSASEIVDDTTKIQTGVKETEEQVERLKSVFGGINASELSATLDPILQDLKAIREAIDNLSKGTSIDGLTASFNRLSDVLDKLDTNFDKIKDSLGTELAKSISADNAINAAEQKMVQSSTQSANTIVQNQQRIQQSYEDTLAKQKQRVSEIDNEISDYTNRIANPTRLDPNVDPFQQIESYQNSIDTLEREKVEILANIEKIESAFKKNENVLNSFKKSLSNIGMGADEIDAVANKISNLGVQIETLNQKKSARTINTKDGVVEKEVLDVDISGVDEYGNAIKLTQQYDMATADLIKSIERVSTVQQKAGKSTDTFAKKQKNAVANLTNQINQSYKASLSKNVNKPINKDSNIEKIKEKYAEVTAAIEKMGAASSDTFDDERNKVKALIDDFKALVKETRNLEHTSSKMKGNSVETQIAIAKQDFDKLKAEAKGYSVDFSKLDDLDISNITEKADVDKFTEALRIARAELNKLKAEVSSDKRINTVENNNKILSNKINDLKRDIENLPKIDLKINDFETEVNGAKISVESLLNSLKEVNTRSDFNAVKSNFSSFKKAAEDAGIAVTEVARKMKSVDDIKLDMELGTYDNQMSNMYDKLDRLSGASKELREGIEQVENAYREMNSALKGTGDEVADRERLVQAEKDYAAALEKTNNLIKIQSRAEAKDARKDKLENDIKLFQADIDRWLVNNSAATKKFGSQMLDLRAKAEGVDRVTLNGLIGQFKLLDKQADKAGLKMMSVTDKIKSKFKEYMAYFSVAEIFMEVTQAMKRMFDTVVEIDTAMTGLYRVTDLTSAQYDTLFNNMISSAKEYGATLNDIINATTDWVRAGFDADTALGLAEVTTMYQHISDLDYDTAAENLITAYNGFKEELNGAFSGDTVSAVNYIADIFNELDNNFAVTSAGLGEALTRSASALDLAGNSIQQTAGMVTGIVEVTQDPEKAGKKCARTCGNAWCNYKIA